jgi:hypothetical protein
VRTFFFSPDVTSHFMPSRRFLEGDFFIIRCPLPVWPFKILPLAVTSNLFAAVFLVLILGTDSSPHYL